MTKELSVGVIIGRFQVHMLHPGHLELFSEVMKHHQKVIVVLGIPEVPTTERDPLDFEMRKCMIQETYPECIVIGIKDTILDSVWSKHLDSRIHEVITPNQKVVLYGGRDSFLSHYSGQFEKKELEPSHFISATQIRKQIAISGFGTFVKNLSPSQAMRAGVIWATQNQYHSVKATVDILIFNEDETKILLVKKPSEPYWRLCGGFSDVNSVTYEQDARREVNEELHISITDPIYVLSNIIDDWRYKNLPDKIKTILFKAKIQFGSPRPDDDISDAKWFDINEIGSTAIYIHHYTLINKYFSMLQGQKEYNNDTTGKV